VVICAEYYLILAFIIKILVNGRFIFPSDTTFAAKKRTPSPDATKGITIANAKYSSEDCATLVQYTIAIVEYTRLCGPLKASLEKLHELEREIEENERLQRESQEEVRLNTVMSLNSLIGITGTCTSC
jgi:hypothetical protein